MGHGIHLLQSIDALTCTVAAAAAAAVLLSGCKLSLLLGTVYNHRDAFASMCSFLIQTGCDRISPSNAVADATSVDRHMPVSNSCKPAAAAAVVCSCCCCCCCRTPSNSTMPDCLVDT